jgi:hypothetical protein
MCKDSIPWPFLYHIIVQLQLRIKITYKYKALLKYHQISCALVRTSLQDIYIVSWEQTVRAIRRPTLPPTWIDLIYVCNYITWVERDFCIIS